MLLNPELVQRVRDAVQRDRLIDTAIRLIEVPSPTRSGGAVADRLAHMLIADGFAVERPVCGWPQAPAVAARYSTGRPGKTLQFNGHLDTVHLPFVPPRVENGVLFGSGASDMKGGLAAAYEAMRAVRDAGLLSGGGILLTGHDLHESPWGDGTQVDRLIEAGYLGDGVLLPEYVSDRLPVAGRGLAIMEITISRPGVPQHEVLGGMEQPNVIAAGADIVRRCGEWDRQVRHKSHPLAGRESVFIGQAVGGEIYNQSPVEYRVSGTRRWLAGTPFTEIEGEFKALVGEVAHETGTTINGKLNFVRDGFELDLSHPLVAAFQSAHAAVTGQTLPHGPKPFVDDGNTFIARGGVPAITHGPNATGAHTLHEAASIDELVRVAVVYALTAIGFCRA